MAITPSNPENDRAWAKAKFQEWANEDAGVKKGTDSEYNEAAHDAPTGALEGHQQGEHFPQHVLFNDRRA